MIEAVTNWPIPKNPMEVRSFLGLAGYYSRFVQNFAKIATTLTNLTRKVTKYEWKERCEEAFQELKKRLTSVPIQPYLPLIGNLWCIAMPLGVGWGVC